MLHSIKIIVHSKSLSWFRLTLFPLGSPGNSSWPASVVDWIWKMLVDGISTVDPNCTDNRQKKEQQIEGAVTTEKRWRIGRGTQRLFSVKYPEAPKGKFWEKDLKTTLSMEKAFWSHFKPFGRLLGKNLSVPHSQQDRWAMGVVIGQNSALHWGGGGNWVWPNGEIHPFSGGVGGQRGLWEIQHNSYSRL